MQVLNFCVFQEYGVNAIVSLVQKSVGEQLANIVLHPAAIKSIICAISPAPDKCCSLIFKLLIYIAKRSISENKLNLTCCTRPSIKQQCRHLGTSHRSHFADGKMVKSQKRE
jgi:hypothetical protein